MEAAISQHVRADVRRLIRYALVQARRWTEGAGSSERTEPKRPLEGSAEGSAFHVPVARLQSKRKATEPSLFKRMVYSDGSAGRVDAKLLTDEQPCEPLHGRTSIRGYRVRERASPPLKESVLQNWKARKAAVREEIATAERAATAIQEKLDCLDEAFLFERAIDIETYDRHAEKLRQELTLLRMARRSSELDELDVEGILAFAERVLPRAADLWVQASLEQRQRFQQLFFPEGLVAQTGIEPGLRPRGQRIPQS